eukprot:4751237-Amphidinium_carterae.1
MLEGALHFELAADGGRERHYHFRVKRDGQTPEGRALRSSAQSLGRGFSSDRRRRELQEVACGLGELLLGLYDAGTGALLVITTEGVHSESEAEGPAVLNWLCLACSHKPLLAPSACFRSYSKLCSYQSLNCSNMSPSRFWVACPSARLTASNQVNAPELQGDQWRPLSRPSLLSSSDGANRRVLSTGLIVMVSKSREIAAPWHSHNLATSSTMLYQSHEERSRKSKTLMYDVAKL